VLSFKYYCWTDIVVACILDVDLDIAGGNNYCAGASCFSEGISLNQSLFGACWKLGIVYVYMLISWFDNPKLFFHWVANGQKQDMHVL